jgi:hypothetical protein
MLEVENTAGSANNALARSPRAFCLAATTTHNSAKSDRTCVRRKQSSPHLHAASHTFKCRPDLRLTLRNQRYRIAARQAPR